MITVDLMSATHDVQKGELLISVSPNPTNSLTRLSVFLPGAAETQLTMTNLLGQTVLLRHKHLSEGENQFDLDLQSLPVGPYFVRISAGGKQGVVKLVKE